MERDYDFTLSEVPIAHFHSINKCPECGDVTLSLADEDHTPLAQLHLDATGWLELFEKITQAIKAET